jgi:Protein of unknwon function (DUF3310)
MAKKGGYVNRDHEESAAALAAAQGVDVVDHPPHYAGRGGMECIDAIRAQLTEEQYVGFLRGTVAAYVWRMGRKGDALEDARKAAWYQARLVEALS